MPSHTVCELRDVSFTYPGAAAERGTKVRPALSGITLSIKDGEWVALLGSNGSGKSTLAKHMNALLVPTQGDCIVYGMSTSDADNVPAIRNAVAMVFQNPENQIVGTTVEEDTAFGPENQGLPPGDIARRVNDALAATGLREKRQSPVYTLSGGEKQRLAVAGALALDSSCLVLDEPTAMLDPQGRAQLLAVLAELHRGGKTLVSITHRLEEIIHCDRAIVLVRGTVAWEGAVPELFQSTEALREWGIFIPPLAALWKDLHARGITPLPSVPSLPEMVQALCP